MDIQSLKIDIMHWLTELKDKNVLDVFESITNFLIPSVII